MMFQEIGFLDRFDAAAQAGFKAVEFLFPYEHPPEAISERLEKNRLTLALFNTVPGDWAGGAASPPCRDANRNSAMASIRRSSTPRRRVARCCTRWLGCGRRRATRKRASGFISIICAGPPTAWLGKG